MYGYIVPFKDTLAASDFVLYRSFYCGVCCETGRLFGQLPRFTTNYDFAFMSALIHDYAQADIVIEEHGCVLNPARKAILQTNPLLTKLVATNVMLCYQKADDGVIDGDGIKYRVLRRMLKKPFKKACVAYPEIFDRLLIAQKEQATVENNKVVGLDRAADAFAGLLRDLPKLLLGREVDGNLKSLCYNIGKFVYLADALDDITDDFKKKRYNPFLATFGGFKSRKAFIDEHRADIEFCFKSVCGRAAQAFNGLRFTQSYSLLKNIVFDGMQKKSEELLASTAKLKNPRI